MNSPHWQQLTIILPDHWPIRTRLPWMPARTRALASHLRQCPPTHGMEGERDGRNEEDKTRDTEWWKEETNLRIAAEQVLSSALKQGEQLWTGLYRAEGVQRHLLLFRRQVYVFIYRAPSSRITLFSERYYTLEEFFLELSTSRRWNTALLSLICPIQTSLTSEDMHQPFLLAVHMNIFQNSQMSCPFLTTERSFFPLFSYS